jgi:hypothetical protein
MKRILSLTLSIALMVCVASAVMARPAVNFGERINMSILEPLVPATSNAREDTTFLFPSSGAGSYGTPGTTERGWSFDYDGGPEASGWTPVDNTAQEGAWWHLASTTVNAGTETDMSAAGQPWTAGDTNNDFAIWCGRQNVCGWINPTGYGNNWDQYIVFDCGQFSDSLVVDMAYAGDFEGAEFDYFQINLMVDGVMEEAYLNNVGSEKTYRDTTLVFYPADFTGTSFGDLIFRFASDGAWSDQDGLLVTNIGAVWVDNLRLTKDGAVIFQDDFEGGVVPAGMSFDTASGAGNYGTLYSNLFSEDVCFLNPTYAWAFFDLGTVNPEYPIPVVAYGPPYVDASVVSPLLDVEHELGNPTGTPLDITADSQLWMYYWVYLDNPLNPLIFQSWDAASQTVELPCLGTWKNDNTVYYGDYKQWLRTTRNITQAVAESANEGTITAIAVRVSCVDMCGYWCDTYGDGTGHAPPPYFDNVYIHKIVASAVAWNVDRFRTFQDNFPEMATGKVRIDNSDNVAPSSSTVVVIGDSAIVELNMDLVGGIKATYNATVGENRPELYMWYRITDGPHAGVLEAAQGDPDGSDGTWSPYMGTQVFDSDTWGLVQCDSSAYQGTTQPSKYCFDLADDYFEAGDRILYFYRAESNDGVIETRPEFAMATDPDLRGYYAIRCLPTAGRTMLFVADDEDVLPFWREAFTYNGYANYDIYYTQAPSSGLQNGLAGRVKDPSQISQYDVIVWDSGDLPSYTLTNALPEDLVYDTDLLNDFLVNSDHNTFVWIMGNQVATDLTNGESFLAIDMGTYLQSETLYYDDYTGILVPKVFATHPALEYLGGDPEIWINVGCPYPENLSVVEPLGLLSETSHEWEEDAGTGSVAGIYNSDPDGDGTNESSGGYTNRVLFNPFSYQEVLDAGYGIPAGADYARKMVGDVLLNLFSYLNDQTPDDVGDTPAFTKLHGNFPNPFNPKTTIQFSLSSPAHVNLAVYDISGRLVKQLANERLAAQDYAIEWNGRNEAGHQVASGVYFYKLQAGDYSATEKMVMLK